MGPSASTSTITYAMALTPRSCFPSQRRRQPSVDCDLLAGNVGTGLRRQQHRYSGKVAGLAPAPQRRPAVHECDEIGILKKRDSKVRLEITRRDGVAGDATLAELRRQRPGDAGERALCRHIAVNRGATAPCRDRGREDDTTIALLAHRRRRALRQEE